MSNTEKLVLKRELIRQKEEVTERLLKNPNMELSQRQLLHERLDGIQKLIDICVNRNRF